MSESPTPLFPPPLERAKGALASAGELLRGVKSRVAAKPKSFEKAGLPARELHQIDDALREALAAIEEVNNEAKGQA